MVIIFAHFIFLCYTEVKDLSVKSNFDLILTY
ncbi:hypothetical protein NO976_03006 [Planktothrix agardhii]|jgi:hypothetical protein|uniref:Uncharacterized protein n=1 Tax=Planktothrix agardhii TaxID=1160 RepID=A0AAD1Q612_PLAAG|nr:hypothetical protein NO2A_00099 [Planktothrix agardhii]BBD56941.1 hypothetical protein NIES204_42770 [Planktothrix agardhii NIES-204]CAD5954165.1 hypothetical protein NIVACYA_03201 [Planktothrix agardhii]CAD5957026.1 hypothetical protein NO976_03006 [Planktothrix agardhii]CAD5968116.1 hypothetical protein PANO66_03763 [Planktothrix agardhii]